MIHRHISRVIRRFSSGKQSSQISIVQNQKLLKKLEENSYVQYKKYPYLPHQDPHSPDYIHSQLDEYHDKVEVQAYNNIINQFKYDLAEQKKVWTAISNLDRPYKRGVPGIDTNLNSNGLTKPQLQDLGFTRRSDPDLQIDVFSNEDRFIKNTPFPMKHGFQHYLEWEKERINRPVTKHFNHGKGYKYDVQVKPQDRYEYLADRLGHPQFLGSPIERLFKLENDIYHPAFLDQPFVKMPSNKPNPQINFEQGEVVYENTRVLQWLKFIQLTGFASAGFFALFVPSNLLFKTNLITDCADQLVFAQYHLVSPATIDIARIGPPLATGAILYTVYTLLNYTNVLTSQYVVKMSYSKDKELVFIKKIDLHGFIEQQVFQRAHLQILPPAQKTGVKDLSSQDEDGLWRITDMNSQKTFLLYNDPRHWNPHLRADFLQKSLGLWDKSYYGYNRIQTEQNQRKWRSDLEAMMNQEALPKK